MEELISSVGFPITICMTGGYFIIQFINNTITNMEKSQQEMKEILLEEVKYNREINAKLLSTNELLAKDLTSRVENTEEVLKDMNVTLNSIDNILKKS